MANFVLALAFFLPQVFSDHCFEKAIPESKRKNVALDGLDVPLGIVIGQWESAVLVSEIYGIIASEILGFHIAKHYTPTSRSQVFLLAGCKGDAEADPTVLQSACGRARLQHVAIENWYHGTSGMAYWLSLLQLAPRDVGPLKYVGTEGLFIMGASHQRGLDQGLALEYFRFYNKSWFDLEPFLPLVSQVDLVRLEFCNVTLLNNPEAMSAYFDATNDTDYKQQVFDPASNTVKVIFQCYQEKWWAAPSCRDDPGKCAAVVSQQGWGLMHLSQRAYFWNMPIALASAKEGHDEYVKLNRDLQGLMYWWSPDSSFALDNARRVTFPTHSPSEWSDMIFKTNDAPRSLGKLVAKGLEIGAVDAVHVVEQIQLDAEQMSQLLVDVAARKDLGPDPKLIWRVACKFLHQNKETWQGWLPNATSCASGSGLVDLRGDFLQNNSLPGDAVGCDICPSGRTSVAWALSSICQECPPGYFQDMPKSVSCMPCQQGFTTSKAGKTTCEACPLGYYANATGMSQCSSCGNSADQLELFTTMELVETSEGPRWIRTQGARAEDYCQCKDGYLLVDDLCLPCPKGARCSFDGQISIEPGFWSSPEDRMSVFKCFTKPSACPGGRPGSCAQFRMDGPGCSWCVPGTREVPVWESNHGECMECGVADYFLVLIPISLGVTVAVLMYGVARQNATLVLSAINLSTLLWQVQVMLQTVSDHPLRVVQLDHYLFEFPCIGGGAPLRRFLFRAGRLVFGLTGLVPFVHVIYALPRSQVKHFHYIINAAGSTLLALGPNVMSSCMLPFLCLEHPNGLSTVRQFDDVLCGDNADYRRLVVSGLVVMLLPTGFVALCFWLLFRELPRRVQSGDMRFVRCCNFLLCNFRPGAEGATATVLLRGILAALVSVISSTAGKVVLMNIVLLVNLYNSAMGHPWRSSVCNSIDVILITGMLMLLDLGSHLLPELEVRTMVNVCMVTACLMVLATVGTVIVSVLRFAMLQNRKPYRIYISYHQVASGCYARMLKMLLDRCGVTSFLEDDAAVNNSLQELLQIVSQDTETLVFLGTREALGQRTCVGELVTARVHEVHTVILAFPSFIEPSEIFIADSGKIIPGVVDLVSLRIGLEDIEQTFRWINDLPTWRVPEVMTHQSVAQVMKFLMENEEEELHEQDRKTSPDCLILADLENLEAAATAMVLQGLMAPLLQQHTCEEVEVWEESQVPKEVMYVLLVCSDLCFESPRFISWLLQLRSLNGAQVAILPIISESGFRFPSLTFHSELLRLPHLQSFDLGSYAKIVRALFGELWFFVAFTPQSSGSKELHLRAEQAHSLLLAARPLAERLAAVEAETKVQDQDEDIQKAMSSKSQKTLSSAGSEYSAKLSLTVRSDLDMEFMADIYQQYFNPTVTRRV